MEVRTPLPPLLVQREGAWFIELMLEGGQETVLAPLGDGAWLVQQLVEKLVLPRMRAEPVKYDWIKTGVDSFGFYREVNGAKTYERKLTADENANLHGYGVNQ